LPRGEILQDLQGFDEHPARVFGKITTASLLGSFKILEDSMRIFERSLRKFFVGSCKRFLIISTTPV